MSVKGIDFNRLAAIVRRQAANFPYVSERQAQRVIGFVIGNRNKRVKPMTDVERALRETKTPLTQLAGYRYVAGEYFNQLGILDRRGKPIYRRKRAT